MAKAPGLGDNLYLHGYDISGDVGEISEIRCPSGVLDVTAIDKSAHERIHGRVDGMITYNHYFNDADDAQFEAEKAKGSGADRVLTWFRGTALGNVAAGLVSKHVSFDWTRGEDGSLMGPSNHMANGYGLEYCEQLTAGKTTHASADSDDASLDNGAASSTGLAVYIQVFSIGSGSPTLEVHSSSDDGAGDAYAVVSGLTQAVAAQTGYRLVTSLTASIERYLKPVSTGTFTDCVFAMCVTREPHDD